MRGTIEIAGRERIYPAYVSTDENGTVAFFEGTTDTSEDLRELFVLIRTQIRPLVGPGTGVIEIDGFLAQKDPADQSVPLEGERYSFRTVRFRLSDREGKTDG